MRTIFILLSFIAFSTVFGQNQKAILNTVNSFPLQADSFIGFDLLNHSYFIKDNVFYKQKDQKIWQYQNVSLGKIKKVDLQNPLKIILLYEAFNTVITLDNQLNETLQINFSEIPIPIVVSAIGMASQNRFWVFNSLNQQIGLYDYLKNTYVVLTPPFTGILRYYESDFNTFQWIDDKQNWYSCDVFGKITTLGKVPLFNKIQFVSGTQLLYLAENQLYFYSIKDAKSTLIDVDQKTFESFYYKDQILSIFTKEEIINYKITTP